MRRWGSAGDGAIRNGILAAVLVAALGGCASAATPAATVEPTCAAPGIVDLPRDECDLVVASARRAIPEGTGVTSISLGQYQWCSPGYSCPTAEGVTTSGLTSIHDDGFSASVSFVTTGGKTLVVNVVAGASGALGATFWCTDGDPPCNSPIQDGIRMALLGGLGLVVLVGAFILAVVVRRRSGHRGS